VPELILASGSPQRKAILEQLGVAFRIVVSGADELESGPPEEVVLENAYRKASAVATELDSASGPDHDRIVLGVDTVVALGGRVYGKPSDRDHARGTLQTLSGRTHRVLSGVCLIRGDESRTAAAVTSVSFRALNEQMIAWYLESEEWEGRAGGYAIQGRGAALVAGIDGDYLNVVGLPVQTLIELAPTLVFPESF
jgi:septum formation protein